MVVIKKIVIICFLAYSALLNAQTTKLSSFVRKAVMTEKRQCNQARGNNTLTSLQEQTITAFVRTSDTDVLTSNSCHILAQWDDICIASIPLSKIEKLASMKQIKRIEAGESCMITNNETSRITKVQDVWNYTSSIATTSPINGTGVVVGVMDIAFDLTHPNFYSSDHETYRIKQLWDQLDFTSGGTSVGEGYVGRQYTTQEELLQKAHTADGYIDTHGTHTTGTAAGSGLYCGMAPGADICLVANYTGNNKNLVPEEERYKYTTATDMLGFKYIFDYAESQGKPCVINFSEGAHDDLYESGLYQEVLNKLIGPGRILCASAGNEGNLDGTYMHKTAQDEKKSAFIGKRNSNAAVFVMKSEKPVTLQTDIYKDNVVVRQWKYDATNLSNYPDSVYCDTVKIDNEEIIFMVNTYPSCFDETQWATDFLIMDRFGSKVGYNMPLLFSLTGSGNDTEIYSAGGYFIRNSLIPDLKEYDHTHNILFPGSAKNVICVGSTAHTESVTDLNGNTVGSNYGANGLRASFSSVGPTISGLTKPDVCSPGTNIVSSFSSFYRELNPDNGSRDVARTVFNGREYPWGKFDGTSMSTPAVTGIIALWLQVCPTLTPDQVKDIIANTSTHPDSSLTYPNNEYGWGEINALAGIQYIEAVYTGIKDIPASSHHTSHVFSIDGSRVDRANRQHGIFIVTENGTARKVIR